MSEEYTFEHKFLETIPSNIDVMTLEKDDFAFLKRHEYRGEVTELARHGNCVQLRIVGGCYDENHGFCNSHYDVYLTMANDPRGVKIQGTVTGRRMWSPQSLAQDIGRHVAEDRRITTMR